MIYLDKFGDMKKPNYIDSITALYIIIIGLFIKNDFFKFIFIINGFSSFLAHSPFIYKYYPKITNYSNYIDTISIFYTLIFYFINNNRFIIFIIMILIDLLFSFKLYYYIIKKKLFLSYLIPLIIDILINKQITCNFFIILILTFICKYFHEENIFNQNIKYHALFHIFGSHMFKGIIDLI